MDRYLDLEIAVLVDRIHDLRREEGFDGVKAVLRELSHVLEVLQEPAAARDALICAEAYEPESELRIRVGKVADHFEGLDDADDILSLIDNAMWIPEDWSAERIEELIKKAEIEEALKEDAEDE